jgi:hypothetical protein
MKNIPVFFVLFFLMLQNSFTQDHKYKLIISTDKSVYEFADEVFLKVKLVNIGKQNDTIKTLFDVNSLTNNIDVYNEKGKKLEWHGLIYEYKKDSNEVLNPGDSIVTEGRLDFNMGPEALFFHSYFPEEKYKATLRYKGNNTQYIKSNTINFKVNPIKENEIQAFNDVKILSDYYFSSLKISDRMEYLKSLTDSAFIILHKYPNSIFTQFTLEHFLYTRNLLKYKYDTTTLREIEFFIEKNPESIFCKTLIHEAITVFRENKSDIEKTLEYLNYLKNKFRSEIINKYIDEEFEKNEWLNKK